MRSLKAGGDKAATVQVEPQTALTVFSLSARFTNIHLWTSHQH